MSRKNILKFKVTVLNKDVIWDMCYIIHPFRALYMFAFVWTWLVVLVNLFSAAFIVTESFLENIGLDKTCIAAWLVDLFPHRLFVHFLWNGSKICFGMDPKCWQQKGQTSNSFDFWFSWIRCMNMLECFGWHVFHYRVCTCCFCFWISLGDICFLFCRRELRQRKSFTQRRQRKRQRRYLPKRLLLVCLMLRTSLWSHKVLK